MALEFTKVLPQLQTMGAMIDALDFDLTDLLTLASARFEAAGDLDALRERIRIVRQSDISGYRGAAPLDAPFAVPVNTIHAPPPSPPQATVMAADGSQIYPNEQAPVHFYLLNTGVFIYHHGVDRRPEGISVPKLAYHKSDVHDAAKRVISNRTVDARRTVAEITELANYAQVLARDKVARPLVALYDNHLLFWANSDVTASDQIMRDYLSAFTRLQDAGAILCGYLDNPYRSRVVTRMLFLLSLRDEAEIKARQQDLARGGDLENLRDVHLFNHILGPGERSAVMVQNSPRNLSYRQRGVSYEIAFFYVKVYNGFQTAIARVDLPMWVARDAAQVDLLHALLLEQCAMQGLTPYPYALTRADELAVVSSRDKRKLDELINLELRRRGIEPGTRSAKDRSKQAARSDKRVYGMGASLPASTLRPGGRPPFGPPGSPGPGRSS
jgi:hypothetical protein